MSAGSGWGADSGSISGDFWSRSVSAAAGSNSFGLPRGTLEQVCSFCMSGKDPLHPTVEHSRTFPGGGGRSAFTTNHTEHLQAAVSEYIRLQPWNGHDVLASPEVDRRD
ncbi:hypothetical protein EYF80_037436 [Liparis tanakae]|uniref:Uncharacterized protein n=1 Tax=Liparis tanakae TaxID=230148 RepID=A0A4Z2GHI0_9TELE|nr:hypothetical protein EYF80_037436 [Liparis tanakae]